MASLYADDTGIGSVIAAQMVAQDFMKDHSNVKVTVVSADHQNKPDVGTTIANQWYDVDHVDMIADVPNSGVALAISQIASQKNKVFVASGPASSDLTGPKCNANMVHWTYDTWMLANGTGKAVVKTGGDTWFFLTSDYAFGHALERDTEAALDHVVFGLTRLQLEVGHQATGDDERVALIGSRRAEARTPRLRPDDLSWPVGHPRRGDDVGRRVVRGVAQSGGG